MVLNNMQNYFSPYIVIFLPDNTLKTMDVVLNYADKYVLTPYVYPASWSEDNPFRQIISLFLVTNIGGYVLYFISATLSYIFIFDKRLLKHPLILQVKRLLEWLGFVSGVIHNSKL